MTTTRLDNEWLEHTLREAVILLDQAAGAIGTCSGSCGHSTYVALTEFLASLPHYTRNDSTTALVEAITTLQAEVEKSRGAFLDYGKHRPECSVYKGTFAPCDCGYSAEWQRVYNVSAKV